MATETRWVKTYDMPGADRVDPVYGIPLVQTFEKVVGAVDEVRSALPSIETATRKLNQLQERQEAIVEQRREADELQRVWAGFVTALAGVQALMLVGMLLLWFRTG
jgi:hypothetical protein